MCQVSRHVAYSFQVANFGLKIKNLVKLDLLHFADFNGDFKICSFIFSIGRICENVVKLNHSLFKGFNFEVLRLNCYE